jgi:hypothetical protein
MHTLIDEMFENNKVILFEIIGHIGITRLKVECASHQHKGSP